VQFITIVMLGIIHGNQKCYNNNNGWKKTYS
jgi:hypothetical protein